MTGTSTMVSDAVDSVRDVGVAVLDALDSGVRRSLGAATSSKVADRVRRGVAGVRPAGSCDCRDACWLPHELPEIDSVVSRCGTARVCITVRNCGLDTRKVFVAATGDGAGHAVGSPAVATIEAFDSGELGAEVTLPDGATSITMLLWVRGCHDHVMRWNLRSDGCDRMSTHHVRIDDCPRTRHHWHDHFAQPHSCTPRHDG
jgi:hypothetical protein